MVASFDYIFEILVLDAGIIGALPAEPITVEVRQVVMVVLVKLSKLLMPETTPAAGTDARLCAHDRGGQDMIAGVVELPIGTVAALLTSGVGDVVAVLAMQARDGVEASAVACCDLLEALLGKHEGPEFAGVGDGARVRYSSGVHSCLL